MTEGTDLGWSLNTHTYTGSEWLDDIIITHRLCPLTFQGVTVRCRGIKLAM